MHELSVATALHGACRAEVNERGGGSLRSVTVRIGELAGVDPKLLALAWPLVTAGTADDGATLAVEWKPAMQRCERCGEVGERQPGTWLRLCPTCCAPLTVSDASDLDIVRLEFAGLEESVARHPREEPTHG